MTADMYRQHTPNLNDPYDITRLPNGHRLHDGGWTLFPGGLHRDSDVLYESNHHVIVRRLAELAGMDVSDIRFIGTDSVEEHGQPFGILHFRHWAVGWVHELAIDATWGPGLELRDDITRQLDNYPILDEHDYCQREWDHNHPFPGECYSDNPDCPCKEDT